MDHIVYEFAYAEFGKYLPMVERGATRTGTVDIIFRSTSESAYVGTTSAYATTTSYVDGWYTGGGNVSATGRSSTVGTGVTTGSTMTWQNSTMLVVIRNNDGKRLWSADYNYKGGWEVSGFYVNTADEAARLCIERISEHLYRELGRERTSSLKESSEHKLIDVNKYKSQNNK